MIVPGDATPPIGGLQKFVLSKVCGFQAPTDEKSSERLKALSDLEGTCSGGEFVVCKARETFRYANKRSKSGIKFYIERDTQGKSSGLCWSFVQGASSN
jgi:hypothetical protein